MPQNADHNANVGRIRAEMKAQQITVGEMAQRMGRSRSTLSRMLNDPYDAWSPCVYNQFFRALGYPPDGSRRSNAAIHRLLGLS
jgi:hypothetical protein